MATKYQGRLCQVASPRKGQGEGCGRGKKTKSHNVPMLSNEIVAKARDVALRLGLDMGSDKFRNTSSAQVLTGDEKRVCFGLERVATRVCE